MSIFQSLVWTCDVCGHTDIIYREINPTDELFLIIPDKTKWAQIQLDVNEPAKLLCEYCANDLGNTLNLEDTTHSNVNLWDI